YSSIFNIINDMKKVLNNSDFDENKLKEKTKSYFDTISLFIKEYNQVLNDIKNLSQNLINQTKENQKLFIDDINQNLNIIQKFAISLEHLDHRNKIYNSIIDKTSSEILKIFNIIEHPLTGEDKNQIKIFFEELRKIITTKEEIEFLKKIYREILNENFVEKEIEFENKYKSKDGKDEGIIIF
ncbi:MAG: hypothetical protein ACK4YF_08755, partial [Exilispira sp.]